LGDFALWRRLDTPGHDAALLSRTESGWSLRGTAVFQHEDGPACLRYDIALDRDWTTRRGVVEGFLSDQEVNVLVERHRDGWIFNGALVPGLGHLVDLDLGFTPSTNLQQLRRTGIEIGQAMDLPVAWLDAGAQTLVELPQRYERRGSSTYWYTAPTIPYEAMLEIASNGFVSIYPDLWQAELLD
jgi:uncharacterized protein